MTRAVRYALMTAGAGTLLLAGTAPALAAGPADVRARCTPNTRVCANGPVDSGNLNNSQNVTINGTANNSGNPIIAIASPNSSNTYDGSGDNSWNNIQQLTRAIGG
ncbi:hypothetical protein ACIP98_01025 [Streptomyces sp. NPDC088354]|uniref:hypothetical protein n=1 Tax=unclassified Streptomyces TaxID=2593676 RepID=UPI0029A63A60|nr:hypothetical protein [Streptomyces sp. MI02-7b]MDX3073436.1 hypothetical protein [Streptomyces sp. MI02-7b]